MRRLHAGLPPTVLLVLDAAYAEYVRRNDYAAGLELAATAENVVMTRTFSKIYGLAGLRLGWMVGPAHVVDAVNRIRGPFNVNGPAIAAGIAALGDDAHVAAAVAHNERWLPWLTREIEALGLAVTPSVGNFVLIHFPTEAGPQRQGRRRVPDAARARAARRRRLRPAERLRMTVGDAEANRLAVAALSEFLAAGRAGMPERLGPPREEPLFERLALIGFGLIGSSIARAARRLNLAGAIVAVDADAGGAGAGARARARRRGDERPGARRRRRRPRHPLRAGRRLWGGREGDARRARARRHRLGRRLGQGRGGRAGAAASAAGRALRAGPSGRRHRAFGAGCRLRDAVPQPLVHPDAAGRHGRAAVAKVREFWAAMGSNVEVMTPEHHDLVLAITSHVPHLIAYNIVGTAADLEAVTQAEVIKFSAGGFRDFTRIAASDPTMWRDVFLNNKEAVLEMLGRFNEDLASLQRAIRWGDGEALYGLFTRTRAIRRGIISVGQETPEPDFGRRREE